MRYLNNKQALVTPQHFKWHVSRHAHNRHATPTTSSRSRSRITGEKPLTTSRRVLTIIQPATVRICRFKSKSLKYSPSSKVYSQNDHTPSSKGLNQSNLPNFGSGNQANTPKPKGRPSHHNVKPPFARPTRQTWHQTTISCQNHDGY